MLKEKEFVKAKKLRENGHSLNEISKIIGISKSTASLWLSDIEINQSGKLRLLKIKENAALKSKETHKVKKVKYLKSISENCRVLKKNSIFSVNECKIFLALLFWGEGSKKDRRLVFMNSDPEMIKVYLFLLRKSFVVNNDALRATLHLHDYHKAKKQVCYWSNVTGISQDRISVYNKKNTGKRKKEGYEGCISIRYGSVKILDELFLIIERFKRNIVAGVG